MLTTIIHFSAEEYIPTCKNPKHVLEVGILKSLVRECDAIYIPLFATVFNSQDDSICNN